MSIRSLQWLKDVSPLFIKNFRMKYNLLLHQEHYGTLLDGWQSCRKLMSQLLDFTICCWWQSTLMKYKMKWCDFCICGLNWSDRFLGRVSSVSRVEYSFYTRQKNLPTRANICHLSSMWMWTISILPCAKWLCRGHRYLTTTAPMGCDEKHNTWLNTLISSLFQTLSGCWLVHSFPSDFIQAGAEFEKETEVKLY